MLSRYELSSKLDDWMAWHTDERESYVIRSMAPMNSTLVTCEEADGVT